MVCCPVMLRRGRGNSAGVSAGHRLVTRSCWPRMSAASSSSMGTSAFPFHFRVVVPQVGGALAVAGDAVERQGQGGGDPQSALDEDQGDQPVGGVVPPGEAGLVLD